MEKILVIEDDRATRKALKQLFEPEGYAVEVADDGSAGLAAFHSSCPDFVILDLISVAEGTVPPIPEGYCLRPENFVDEFP